MRLALLSASTFVLAACSSLVGRPQTSDASSDARADVVDERPTLGDASDGGGDGLGGSLGATPDRTLRRLWTVGVTAAWVHLDARARFVLAAGAGNDAERDVALARLTPDGEEDRFASADATGFSRVLARRRGVRLVAIPRAVSVDRVGRIVAAGNGLTSGLRSGLVARWSADGAPDMAFGSGGAVVIEAPEGSPSQQVVLRAMTLDDDGAAVVAGGDSIPYNPATMGVYARVTAEGALDATFGGVHVDTRFAAFSAIARDAEGYVLAGESARGGVPTLLYLDANGNPREGVGDRGAVAHTVEAAAPMVVRAMVRDTDGGLVVAGGAGPMTWTQTPLRLVRFTPTRRPDTTWAQGGVLRAFSLANWNYEMSLAGGIVPWTQGSFLVLGQEGFGYRVHRVLRDGRVDRDFGLDGSLYAQPEGFQYVFEMLPDERGGLWVFYRAAADRALGGIHYAPR